VTVAAMADGGAAIVGPPALTRSSSTKPTTKNSPTATMAARWLPASSSESPPNTSGPKIAPVLPTSE
jgi:hypothetical protein